MPDVAAAEINPASDWCQRWNARQHSWRHRSEGGFDPDRYEVVPVDELTAKTFVVANHYSGSYPASSRRYGLIDVTCRPDRFSLPGRLVGVCVLGIPASRKVLTGVLPDLEPYVESLELSRLVLADECPGNSESWFVARCFADAAAGGVRGIVSFADPVPRSTRSGIVFPGHVGWIYQALGGAYTGRGTARTLTLLPSGEVLNDRAQQKVRAQDRGHEYVEKKLVGLGAAPLRAGQNPARWLTEALDIIGVTRLRHGGNHRYVFAVGPSRRSRAAVRIVGAGRRYPKRPDSRAA